MQENIALNNDQQIVLDALVARREAREPMAQILGKKEFWGLEFTVTKDTLMPRPDSETLITTLMQMETRRDKLLKILDLGTGTGCLLLSILSEYRQSSGVGVDQSEAALSIAAQNATALGFEKRCVFIKSDWTSSVKGVWDIIISNPPYIPCLL